MAGNFLDELRNNSRLRWGVALIVGIFWFYGILSLRDILQEQEQQYHATAQNISRLRAQLAQPEWAVRVAPAKAMAVQLEGGLWQAATSGLAQAAFQDWLNAAMLRAGVTRTQIAVSVVDEAAASASGQEQEPRTPADLWKIRAKLSFDFNAPALLEFLSQIENSEKQISIDALNVRKEPAAPVEIELYGYFQKQAVPAKTDDKLVPL